MTEYFQLKHLPIKLPKEKGGTIIEYLYYPNFKRRKEVGTCNVETDGLKMKIKICTPSKRHIQKRTNFSGDLLEMFYYSLFFHEEAHAAQLAGEWRALYFLAKETLGQEFPSTELNGWDSFWHVSTRYGRFFEEFEQLNEGWAELAEIVGLKIKGYSQKNIINFRKKIYNTELLPDVSDHYIQESRLNKFLRFS